MIILDVLRGITALQVVLALVCLWTVQILSNRWATDRRIKHLGASRAPLVFHNPISGIAYYFGLGKAQSQTRISDWANDRLDDWFPEKKNFVEFTFTGQRRILMTREPEQIKAILATKFQSFGHGPRWHKIWQPFLGNGIFATDGQQWHDSRAMIRAMFVKDRVRDLAIFDRCTEKLLSKFPAAGVTVDVKDLFYRLTLDTTFEFLLGESVNSLDNPKHAIADAIEVAQRTQMHMFVLSAFYRFIPKAKYFAAIRRIEDFIEPIIARTVALPDSELEGLSKSDENFTFLHSIAQFTKDPKDIRDQIFSVLLAGRDTTAATLSWAIYEICNHPQAWNKLRKEVLSVLGPDGKPSYESLKDLAYLRYIMNETLRLHPAVPINMRQCLEDVLIPGEPGGPDIAMFKGDTVTILTLGMQSRKDIYPSVSEMFADPAMFSPERWEHWTPTPWTYTPFHGGPRICVGQNFALTELAYCLVRMAQTYTRMEYRGDWHAQMLNANIIGTPAFGVPVAFFKD